MTPLSGAAVAAMGRLLVAAAAFAAAASASDVGAAGAVPPLRAAAPAVGAPVAANAAVPAAPGAERLRLLADAEALLATSDAASAEALLDQAALLEHAADTELALVRTYLQAGDYRRALAFAAHVAGAHADEPEATAIYAWLLHVGGQGAVANRLLDQAEARQRDEPTWRRVRALMADGPSAGETPATVPSLPFGPHAVGVRVAVPVAAAAAVAVADGVPAAARVAATGVLVGDGWRAVAPGSAVSPATRVWLRDGLGRTAAARVDRIDAESGVAVLRLSAPLTPCAALTSSPAAPFAGSPSAMVDYRPTETPATAWPLLRQGFFARWPSRPAAPRPLGIDAPAGPLGGPVFDAAGRLAGMASTAADGAQSLVGIDALTALLGQPPAPPAAASAGTARVAVDALYECALRVALQVIVTPPQHPADDGLGAAGAVGLHENVIGTAHSRP